MMGFLSRSAQRLAGHRPRRSDAAAPANGRAEIDAILASLAAKSAKEFLRSGLPDNPLELGEGGAAEIEINDSCNLDCVMCKTSLAQRSKGLMDLGLFEETVAMLAERGRKATNLHTIGDPLANRNLARYLEVLRRYGMHVKSLSTNGLLMRRHLDTVFEFRDIIGKMRPSIDGASKHVYEHIRAGGSWEDLLDAWLAFAERNAEAPKPYPVVVSSIASRDNFHELAFIPQVFGFLAPPECFAFSFINSLSPSNEYFFGASLLPGHEVRNTPCDQPFRYVYVLKEGVLSLCCRDYHGDVTFGRVADWKQGDGPALEAAKTRLQSIRKAHLEDDVEALPALCRECWTIDPRLSSLLTAVIRVFYATGQHPAKLQRFLLQSLPSLQASDWDGFGRHLDGLGLG